jgi:hypothetical protein
LGVPGLCGDVRDEGIVMAGLGARRGGHHDGARGVAHWLVSLVGGPKESGLEDSDYMVMDVEIELRIPALTVKKEDGSAGRIDNTHVRFKKVIRVPAFPPQGSTIQLTAGSDLAFECTIARADWHEEKQLFVLACKYPKQRMFPHEYEMLINDPEWQRMELPA